ncbi:hypothetical protein ACFL1B_04710 [Nanoarchaeota archaeon]
MTIYDSLWDADKAEKETRDRRMEYASKVSDRVAEFATGMVIGLTLGHIGGTFYDELVRNTDWGPLEDTDIIIPIGPQTQPETTNTVIASIEKNIMDMAAKEGIDLTFEKV